LTRLANEGTPVPIAKDLKNGMVVEFDGAPCVIEQILVQSPSARGASTLYKVRARDLKLGGKVDRVFKGTDVVRDADFARRSVQFMYKDATHFHFMDDQDYNQFALTAEALGDKVGYLVENMPGLLSMIYNGEPIGIQLPSAVDMPIVECNPGVKGNSATGRTKPAKLATGLVVHVPEYISPGEMIRIDTTTGEFVCRAEPTKSF
jgi:elongation factor P